jgi:hypothetical protein
MVHEGKILDGRNRYRAIKLMPSWTGKLDLWWLTKYLGPDPVEYVISLNCHRRHLTESQRAAAAAELANMPNHRPSDKGDNCPPYSVGKEEASELFRVSSKSIQRAKAIKEASPEKFEEVKAGKLTLNAALKAVKPDPEPELTPGPPKSWTAPEMGGNQDQPEPKTNPHLNMILIEAMTAAIKMVSDSETLNRGELRSALARARALIDQKLEDM